MMFRCLYGLVGVQANVRECRTLRSKSADCLIGVSIVVCSMGRNLIHNKI